MNHPDTQRTHVVLTSRYGELMTASEVRRELKISSPAAFAQLRKRGHVALASYRMPGRRGLFFKTLDVAEELARLPQLTHMPEGVE